MTAERALRFVIREAVACRTIGYSAMPPMPDMDRMREFVETIEAFTLLLPALEKIMRLERMDDFEAAAVRYEMQQDLIGHNGHVHAT